MADTGLVFEGTFNHPTTGLFKDNTTNDIGADDVRTLVTKIKEDYLNRTDDPYTAVFPSANATGTDTYAATLSPPITAYTSGQGVRLVFANANTGAATINLNALGAKAITKNGAIALAAGDIAAGQALLLYYDGTQFQVQGSAGAGVGTVTSVTGTTNRITSTGGATPVLDIDAAYDAAQLVLINAKVADAINNGTTTVAPSQNAVFDALALKQALVNTDVALTDAASMDLTAIKHTLTTSSATRTFTISYTGDDITLIVTLNATSSTFTFPATSLCISEGIPSGNNTFPLAGVSGDKYAIAVKKIGSDYYVVCKNFGQ